MMASKVDVKAGLDELENRLKIELDRFSTEHQDAIFKKVMQDMKDVVRNVAVGESGAAVDALGQKVLEWIDKCSKSMEVEMQRKIQENATSTLRLVQDKIDELEAKLAADIETKIYQKKGDGGFGGLFKFNKSRKVGEIGRCRPL